MSNLGEILGWKFGHAPGIRTRGGAITNWPSGLGPQPSAADIATYTAEHDAARPGEEKDEEIAAMLADKGAFRVLKAVVLALNDGSLAPGANVSNAALKAAIKAKM